jgi:thiol-disulfide isomerase/thioredoxin
MTNQISGEPIVEGDSPRRSVLPILFSVGLIAGTLMAVAVIATGPGGLSGQGRRLPTPIPDTVREGESAPDFTSTTSDGETISLSDYRGSVVVVNFWATWCAPCKVEMPVLQEAEDEGKLVVLAVNAAGESANEVNTYLDDLGVSFTAILDLDGKIVDQYGVRVYPTNVLVGSDGVVIAEQYGPLTTKLIDQYLADIPKP